MSRMYTDYTNRIALSVPDEFIDVKTGVSRSVSAKIEEQIEYHMNNGTLVDFIFSALNQYLKPKVENGMNEEILQELFEIKKMMKRGYVPMNSSPEPLPSKKRHTKSQTVDLKEVEDVLDAFGG